jgi:uncharacterized protein YukE
VVAEVRTVSSPEAESAVQQLATILSGNLSADLERLRTYATKLSSPDTWDGRAATEFRGPVWTASNAALMELQSQLDTLRQKVDIITRDIMQAG